MRAVIILLLWIDENTLLRFLQQRAMICFQGVTHLIQEAHHKDDACNEAWVRQALGYEQSIDYTYLEPFNHANSDVKTLLDEGFLPEAIANYLLALGNRVPKKFLQLKKPSLGWILPLYLQCLRI